MPYHKVIPNEGEYKGERAEGLPQSKGSALPQRDPNECAPGHLESRREVAEEFSSQKKGLSRPRATQRSSLTATRKHTRNH